jgi:hypothetical protein
LRRLPNRARCPHGRRRTPGGPALQGQAFGFFVDGISARFGGGRFGLEAFMPGELGGDATTGVIDVPS